MDDPNLCSLEHERALNGLARLNQISGAAQLLWSPLAELMLSSGSSSLRVLDIATGRADVPLQLHQIAKRKNIRLQIDGCDISETALSIARQRAVKYGAPCQFFQANILEDKLPGGYDVIMTSLFTHHLSEAETVLLLSKMKDAAGQMILINDLERSRLGLGMVWLATRLVTASPIVHFDGPASVRNAYTADELAKLANQAGLNGAQIRTNFPCRMLLTWRRQHES